MLVPGVSRNMRLYTKEVIAKAVGRMQARIADPAGLPIVMRTHHEAGDNSAHIVGRLTSATLTDDGAARYTALLYDTRAGRDIAGLVTPKKQPALKSVSIHGYWLGPVTRVEHDGESVTTGEDLEINAVDWTATPGVTGAVVDDASWLFPLTPSTESAFVDHTPISESMEAAITEVTEAVDEDELAWNAFVEADYTQKQKDAMIGSGAMRNAQGNGSYPIRSKSDLRKAIRAVGRGGANHNAIRRHIMARAKALGLSNMIPPNWNPDGSIKESQIRFGEIREYMGGMDAPGGGGAGFCIDAYNGPVCLTLRAGCLDPSDLRAVAAAAMDAACNALQALDPDMDADIDVGDGESVIATLADGEHVITGDGIATWDQIASTENRAEGDVHSTVSVQSGRQYEGDPPAETVPVSAGVVRGDDLRRLIHETVTRYTARTAPAPTDATADTPGETGESQSTTEEVPAVSEATSTTEAAETTAQPTRTLTDADIAAFGAVFAAALKEHAVNSAAAETQAPPSGTTAEQATTTTAETMKATEGVTEKALLERAIKIEADLKAFEANAATRETALRDAVLAQVREEMLRANGVPTRAGYRVHENEQRTPDVAALYEDRTNILLGDFGLTPVPQPGTGTAPTATVTQPEVPRPQAS